jgi:hypothetical protein
MAVSERSYNTIPGAYELIRPELAFRDIVKVSLAGTVYHLIYSGEPGNMEVLYTASTGGFRFNVPFGYIVLSDPNSPVDTFITDKIHIIWQE